MKDNHAIIKRGRRHDAGYKALLSHKAIVRDFIIHFVPGDFVKEIDFESLAPYRECFVAKGRKKRTLDVLWRANIKGGGKGYLYILIEPQSTVYRWMAIKVLVYVLLLYQDLIVKKMIPRRSRLPVVVPLVLYRGEQPWKSPHGLKSLIEKPLPGCEPYVPGFSFFTVRVQHMCRAWLRDLDSIMAKVFLMESAEVDELKEARDAYEKMYQGIEDEEIRTILEDWYDYFRESSEVDLGSLRESEAGAMLKTKFLRYRKKISEEADKKVLEVEALAERRLLEKAEAERRLQEEKAEAERRLLEMVRAMKARGMEIPVIQEITGLTVEEIREL